MRLIDADALDYELGSSDRDIYVRECLQDAPTVTLGSLWIPCSERPPEEDVDVLCQTVSGARLVASYGLLNPWHKEKGWITSEFNRLSKEMIKAWMPLPEEYRGE